MKVGVDARSLLTTHPRGEGRTLLRLYREISLLRPGWGFRFFGEEAGHHNSLDIANAEVDAFQMPGFRFNLWENLGLPLKAWRNNLDILHCSSSSAPRWTPVPIVLTVHDVIPLVFNDGWPVSAVTRFRTQLAYGLDAARAVITVSHHTKQDLLRLFDMDPAKIHVVHWGVDAPAPTHNAVVLQKLSLSGRYVMAFGGDARRKNTAGVLEAFAAAALPEVQLVLVGLGRGAARVRYETMVRELGIAKRVRLLDYVTDAELEAVLLGAECLLYPSLYEGFGLPVLEAMSRGVPLIASNTTSIPEVAGSAALLVDPESPTAIAASLESLCGDAGLRETLATQGRARAAMFPWRATAAATVEIFERVLRTA